VTGPERPPPGTERPTGGLDPEGAEADARLEASAVEAVFGGPGPARATHRAVDWSATALGPVRHWAEGLRATVRLALATSFPMIVFWGPDYVQIYNDAFTPSLADKAAAGRPGRETWAEVWEVVHGQFQEVRRTGEAYFTEKMMFELRRRGGVEESYFTYSFSPLHHADGTFAGILSTNAETTHQILAQRRLDTLRVLAAAGTGAQTTSQAGERAVGALRENSADLPFVLLYSITEGDPLARLAATAGLPEGAPSAAPTLELDDRGSGWPLAGAVAAGGPVLIDDVQARFPGLHAGPWPELPGSALLLPVRPMADGEVAAVLVAGLSPRLVLDDRYREFLDLVVARIAASLAEARTREGERQRIEMLAELDRAKTDFFSNVSHEFRTPLTLVMGPVEQMRARVTDPELRAELDTVHRNGLRMGKLVNTLLDFSRIQAGRIEARYEPVDLAAATGELASVFRSAMQRAGLDYRVDCPDLGEPVHVDRSMWEKIVLNLLSNALKFTFEGSVAVSLHREADAAVLRVADTGVGVPASERGRLFERFHRVARTRARSTEGSGIGLALVQELVTLHRGTVEVTSTVDLGSTFTVRMPLGREHLAADHVHPAAPAEARSVAEPYLAESMRWLPEDGQAGPVSSPAGSGSSHASGSAAGSASVLVIDDNADMRDYLRRLLAVRYRVRTAADGEAGLADARAEVPDLIVADVMMPGLDGIELITALRADPAVAAVPVVLLSARAGQEAAVEGLAAGADDYLVKPFSSAELLARVDSHVRLGRSRREAELRFRALADSTPALIWVDGPGSRRLFVNRAWSEFVGGGHPTRELGSRWREHIHPDDRARYAEVRAAAEADGAPFEVEYRLRDADGRHRWVLDRGAPVGPAGQPEGYVGGCLDIDTRHRERERQRLLTAITGELDRGETTRRREADLVYALVTEGLVDLARLAEVGTEVTAVRAVAARTPASETLLAGWTDDADLAREAVSSGEPVLVDVDASPTSPADRVREGARRAALRGLGLRGLAVLPLVARGRVTALLTVARVLDSPALDADDLALLVEIGRRAATALDNALLLERERRTRRRLELMQRATAALSVAATPAEVAEATVRHFERILDAPAAGMFELRENGVLDALSLGGWNEQVRRNWSSMPIEAHAPVSLAARRRMPVWVERPEDWRQFPRLEPVVRAYGYPSIACLPLVTAGTCLGVVCFGFHTERVLSPSERATTLALADHCAQALQRAGLLAAESEARRAAEDLSRVVGALSGATTPAEVGAVILDYTSALGAARTVVMLRDRRVLRVLAGAGPDRAGPDRAGPDRAGRDRARPLDLEAAHPVAYAARTGEPVWLATRSDSAWPGAGFVPDEVELPIQVALPMVVGNSVLGAIGMSFGAEVPAMSASQRAGILTVAGQCAQALDRARLYQNEHEVADVLQHVLLPHQLPELPMLSAAARYLPAAAGARAGGDWYDLLPVGGSTVALVVGDVVGHGAPAAAVMGQLRSALAGYLLEGHSPAVALELLDRYASRVDGALGSTCVCLTLDQDSGELRYAGAGHPPILVVEPDGARYLERAGGTVLGVVARSPYREARTVIEPGTSVVLYSDGLIERREEVLDVGLDRLTRAAGGLARHGPEALVTTLVQLMIDDPAPADDLAVVAVRLLPAPLRGRLPAVVESTRRLRRTVESWAGLAALPAELLEDLQLTLGEAAANACEHAYLGEPGEFEYAVTGTAESGLEVEVCDGGTWREPPPDSGFRGRGLRLVTAIAERLDIHTGTGTGPTGGAAGAGRGTTVRFRLRPLDRGGAVLAESGPDTPPVPAPSVSPPSARRVAGPVHAVPQQRTWSLSGDLTADGVDTVRTSLLEQLHGPGDLVLDLRGAGYVGSAGVELLVEATMTGRAHGVHVSVLVQHGSRAARVIDLTGLSTELMISHDGD
jgi:anti-anti-sigma factor